MKNSDIPLKRSDPYKPKNRKWQRIKSDLRNLLRKSPALDTYGIKIWRSGKFVFWRTRWKLEALMGSWRGAHVSNIEVDKIYWISPQKIIFSALKEFKLREYKGRILGGDWDNLGKRFESLDIFIAIKQVCVEGNNWTDTVFYQRVLEDIKEDPRSCDYQDERDLLEKCKRIESLYNEIKLNGYKTQKELSLAATKIQDPIAADEEVTISVGRFGDLLFSDGVHRLAIAKILKTPTIPIKITVRHKDWFEFRKELLLYARDDPVTKDGKLYQPLTHPDLLDLPASHASEDRFQLIKQNTSVNHGSLLDIGANLGYFCHRFEELGVDCYAVENHPPTVYFLKKLARAENRSFKIITESVLDDLEIKNIHFDIVLALNIFHHFLKTKEDYDKLVDLLNNLQMDELFFEPHLPHEPHMIGAYINYSPDEFVRFIIDNTKLKTAVLLGVMNDNRPLYKLL